MMCKIKSCAGLHLFKAAILCSQRNYLNDIDPTCLEDWKKARGTGEVLGTQQCGDLRLEAFLGGPRLTPGGPFTGSLQRSSFRGSRTGKGLASFWETNCCPLSLCIPAW